MMQSKPPPSTMLRPFSVIKVGPEHCSRQCSVVQMRPSAVLAGEGCSLWQKWQSCVASPPCSAITNRCR